MYYCDYFCSVGHLVLIFTGEIIMYRGLLAILVDVTHTVRSGTYCTIQTARLRKEIVSLAVSSIGIAIPARTIYLKQRIEL